MPRYELMEEAAYDAGARSWRPAVVWVYSPEEGKIVVYGRAAYEALAAAYNERVQDARRRGFQAGDIWRYWAEQGGNGYGAVRTSPVAVHAPTLLGVAAERLREMAKRRA